MYTDTVKLHSAFFNTANSAVTLSLWFQPELPYPSVDLSRLKPKEEDTYPNEFRDNFKNGLYVDLFNQAIRKNFPLEYALDERRFDEVEFYDQYRQEHYLPLYLSKITPPDSNNIIKQEKKGADSSEEHDAAMQQRGIRTLDEVAHFVKCIPFRGNLEYQVDRVWSSPDFVLTMRLGSLEEHAILLASMFRGVKYETTADFD